MFSKCLVVSEGAYSMFELKEQNLLAYFSKLNPIERFGSVPETTIHGNRSIELSSTPNKDVNKGQKKNSIKVLSWNIAKNNHDKVWRREFLAMVEWYQPDKIFLQEVRLCAELRVMPELAEMGWSFAHNFIDTLDNTYSGVLIAAKADHVSSQALMTQYTEPVTNTPKISLFSEYWLSDEENLLAVNTHLINFVDLGKFKAQLWALEARLQKHSGAIIFSGDFNTWNRARWLMLYEMAKRLQLTPVSFSPEDTQKIKNFWMSPPLDYIFFRGFSQKPFSARVIDTITSSDHNPLLVELCG